MDLILLIVLLLITGFFAGVWSGLFGIGGASIMTPVTYSLLLMSGVSAGDAVRIAFCTSLAVVLPVIASSAIGHSRRGNVLWDKAVIVGCGGIAGAVIGGYLASVLPEKVLFVCFAIFVIISAVKMLLSLKEDESAEVSQNVFLYPAIGITVGIVSGLTGLGGGVICVPLLLFAAGFKMKHAVGTSSGSLIFSSAAAFITYMAVDWFSRGADIFASGIAPYSIGSFCWLFWIILIASSVPAARLGVVLSSKCSGMFLRKLFAVYLVCTAIFMMIQG